jgi:hypothetical protein
MITTVQARAKRTQNPRKIFSPSVESVQKPSNYLLFMSDTMSYSIIGRTSIKHIQGKMATFVFNQKKITGEIVYSGECSISIR